MTLKTNGAFVKAAIHRLEQNIEVVEHSNFSDREKLDLKGSYMRQIAKYKQKLLSFYPGRQN